jgi:anaerobic selenocysteine-containing dehydrogenase
MLAAIKRLLSPVPVNEFAADARFGPMRADTVPERWVRTTCGYCSVGCGMLVGVRNGEAVAVRGDPDHPVNEGRLCPKGLSEHLFLRADGRLTRPMVDGHRVSWDRALDTMVDRFTSLIDQFGPESVAVVSTGQLVTEEFYALGKLVRLGMGLSHYDGNTTLCMASAVSGYKMAFGSDGPPGSYADLRDADCLLLIGANVADNHPLLAPRILAGRRGDAARIDGPSARTVITVDPRITKTTAMADMHLAVKPRTDVTLLNAMINVIITEGLFDRDYVRDHCDGFAELAEHAKGFPLDRAEAVCDVAAEHIRHAAQLFANAKRATCAWTMGVNHSVQGAETVALISALCAITGNIGKRGASPFSITGQCNAMGTREAGFTASMPGYRNYDDAQARQELAALWDIDEARLPTQRGRAYPDIIEGIIAGTIKALWVIGTNPVVSFPNRELLCDAFDRLELLVVQDGFTTPTTERAHIVLPAAIWGEKDGTYTNSERRVSRVRTCVEPIGDSRSDFDIFLDVADRWGVREEIFPGWKTPEDAFTEWRIVSSGRLCDYSDITYARLDEEGGVQWGGESLYVDGQVPTITGRIQLKVVQSKPLTERPNDRYPFVLNTGRTVEHWHTRTKTGRIEVLERLAPESWIEVHPADASELGVRSGEYVAVSSQRGRVDRVIVKVTSTVRAGEVFMPFHYDEACANRLTLGEFDPVSREPNYKQCAVRIDPR